MSNVSHKERGVRKHTSLPAVAASSLAGTAVEWYDFFLYGTAAALVFNKLFFPSADPMVGTMLALGTFAAGFVARPLGAIVLGHLGDKHGRKSTLVASLLLMGVATALIALIPPYASIGIIAPLILLFLRLVQGFALGGEWGGAVLLVSEYSDNSTKRAFWASWPNVGPPLGNLMAAGVLAVLSAVMPQDQFLAWGWRIAFGLSALLVIIGLVLRLYVQETPLFLASQAKADAEHAKQAKLPLAELFRGNWKEILIAAGSRMGENAGFYIYSLFLITYVTEILKMDRQTGLNAVMVGQGVAVVAIPVLAIFADRIGRKPMMIGASVATVVWGFAFFALLDTRQPGMIILAAVGGLLIFAAYSSVIGAFFSELFPTKVRYSGTSVAYNVASLIAGSLSPIIALALYQAFGSGQAIALYLVLMGVISIVAVSFAKETKDMKLSDLDEKPTPVAAQQL
ncbi:MFS transporter [Paenarthrobacter ureafaciens]|uniref:MFS transporter n=1 Tax=Micrococcaceae TaxID=1268 RepID=UPI000CDC990B|nr:MULTISPECIES: MFS transporter [Micrococcaceae]AUZ34602.1 MFS transporter [Arthrobacter sp. PGP41]MUU69807.1 MFS transporter [Pseudarthrobacter sp. GA104]NWL29269.1 MFS transporter [Paenarthrobacter ureafaciens]QSZ54003.1 MFS transporter [Paenarthrobacter ureafaciens]